MSTVETKSIVIIGGGIIGCTAAYYLARHPLFSSSSSTITLIEPSMHGPAQGASGKAGGLVAKWAYPKELVDVSFAEHVKLAQEHNGKDKWGWRFVSCGSWEGRGDLGSSPGGEFNGSAPVQGGAKSLEKTLGLDDATRPAKNTLKRRAKGLPDDLLWVREDLTDSYSAMAGDGATAQVHPYLFTMSMLELAQAKGVVLLQGKATSITQAGGKVTGVNYVNTTTQTHKTLSATHVVLAAGAWSPTLVPDLPISATRAHSITIRPPPTSVISPYVLFTEIAFPSSLIRKTVTPEIYARPNDEIYACGPGDDSAVPNGVDDVVVELAACDDIHRHVSSISQELRDGIVEKRQACFLPVVAKGGGPIIGEAAQIAKGLIIATGHTCWGICNAPGTARAISELVMDGKIRCANLEKLRPSIFL